MTKSLLLCNECDALCSFLVRLSCLGFGRLVDDNYRVDAIYKRFEVMTLYERLPMTPRNECAVFFPRIRSIIDFGGLRSVVGIVIRVNGCIE